MNKIVPESTNRPKRLLSNEPERPCSKRQKRKFVQWNENISQTFEENMDQKQNFDPNDIWYTRREYEDFLVDRLRTVEFLRASGGDDSALNEEFYCLRGLEPFKTSSHHEEMHSKRRFHQSTVILEQVRQSMLGIRDPERFRLLVAPQSEMALRRAQELAALDEHEVYNKVCRRNSLMTTMVPMYMKSSSVDDTPTLSIQERIKRLQEWNARRLMEIYQQPGNGLFRFQTRRDSLVGSNAAVMGNLLSTSRFPIRRDSLGNSYK